MSADGALFFWMAAAQIGPTNWKIVVRSDLLLSPGWVTGIDGIVIGAVVGAGWL